MRFFVRSSAGDTAERLRLRDAIFAAIRAARRGGIAIVGEGSPDAEDEALVEAYRRWQRKYGDEVWAPLAADDVYRLLEEIARPHELGLQPVRRSWFGRQVNPDIVQFLRVAPYKGYCYGFAWGVSLAFVPHEFEHRVRFHRTLKAAERAPDLFEDAADELKRRGGDERDGFMPAGYGADILCRDATNAWEFVRPRVEQWYASTTTVEGVLERAREQMAAPGVPRHWPDPALVAAFALARLGRDADARAALDDWLATRGSQIEIAPTAAANLIAALETVGTRA